MDELFRFTVIRPPQSSAAPRVSLEISGSDFQGGLRSHTTPSEQRAFAAQYQRSTRFVASLEALPDAGMLEKLAQALEANPGPNTRADLEALVRNELGPTPPASLAAERERLVDSFLALLLSPDPSAPAPAAYARPIRALDIVNRLSTHDPFLDAPGAAAALMGAPLALPPAVISSASKLKPVGFADLLVVKQHIKGYAPGEIAEIENVLRGETRAHVLTHALVNQRQTTLEAEKSTDVSQEEVATERSSLKQEVDRSVQEKIAANANLEVGYGSAPSFYIKANAGFSYENVQQESSKIATEVSKEVTKKAASRVTERVRQQVVTTVKEKFLERQQRGFQNATSGNIRGIYQFIDKVYECQVFRYGKRWLFDVIVPEPAAFLLSAGVKSAPADQLPPPPMTKDGAPVPPGSRVDAAELLKPTDPMEDEKGEFYYAKFVTRYGVAGVVPPPQGPVTVGKGFNLSFTDSNPSVHTDTIEVPSGFHVQTVKAAGMWDGSGSVDIFVGQNQLPMKEDPDPAKPGSYLPRNGFFEVAANGMPGPGSVPVSIQGHGAVKDVVINVLLVCAPTEDALARWRQDTYDSILQRYQQLVSDYADKVAQRQFAQGQSPTQLGRTPEMNRITERVELKKAVLSILQEEVLTGFDDVARPAAPPASPPADPYLPAPAVKSPTFEADGATLRFFEQAFEWETLSYTLYPYFWGRAAGWREALGRTEEDPLFESFLRAGAARVVFAVRPGFEKDVFYYLWKREVWGGGELPDVGDPRYLPIVDELRAQSGAPGDEVAHGPTWELRLPTSFVALRDDDRLPEWTHSPGEWDWAST